tara:strand:- start:39 stop:188 length:150 start_codon:yes stop_codon:yes gene_type:complete
MNFSLFHLTLFVQVADHFLSLKNERKNKNKTTLRANQKPIMRDTIIVYS